MKISDEQLQAWIELLETAEPKSDAAMQNIIPLAVARELQQLREERDWRKVSEELPEILPNVVQVEVWKSGMIRPVMMDVPVLLAAVKIGKFGANDVFEYYWRLLPTDLPEVE